MYDENTLNNLKRTFCLCRERVWWTWGRALDVSVRGATSGIQGLFYSWWLLSRAVK